MANQCHHLVFFLAPTTECCQDTPQKTQPKPLPPQKTGARTPFFLPGYVNDTYHVQNSQSAERAGAGLVPGGGPGPEADGGGGGGALPGGGGGGRGPGGGGAGGRGPGGPGAGWVPPGSGGWDASCRREQLLRFWQEKRREWIPASKQESKVL